MRVLDYGMVGGGEGAFIGEVHRKALRLDGKARLVSGCFSRSWDNTLATGEKLGVQRSRLYKSYEDMAKAEAGGLDFVVVVTPNNTHFDVCKAFLEAGVNVACDKPLTREISEAEELSRIAREKGLLFAVTYTYSGHVTFKYARDLIASGEIGDIRMVMGEYPQGWMRDGEAVKRGAWRTDPARSGLSNALGDIGTHVENAVSTMTNLKIKRVLAKMDSVIPGHALDDNSVVLVEYVGGATGAYWISQIAIGGDNDLRVRIYGSKGTIEWSSFNAEDLYLTGADGIRKLIRRGYKAVTPAAARYARMPAAHVEGFIEAMGNIYSNFCDCVQKRIDGVLTPTDIDYPGLAEGSRGVKFIHRCVESSRNGNVWVDFE